MAGGFAIFTAARGDTFNTFQFQCIFSARRDIAALTRFQQHLEKRLEALFRPES